MPIPEPVNQDDQPLVLLPPEGAGSHPVESLSCWHRARNGVSLLLDDDRWTGIAAVDRSLMGAISQDDWTLERLHALGQPRAVAFRPRALPSAAFLDRDGTIIEDRDYLADPEGVTLLPGAAAGLRALSLRSVPLVVISNQSGVGSGRFTLEQLGQVNARLQDLLSREGVTLDAIYCCIHQADAGCDCRKPKTGLVSAAAERFGFDVERAVVVGDKSADLGLARTLGVPGFLVTTGYGKPTLRDRTVPADYVVDDLAQFARICSHHAGLAHEVSVPAPR